jgi:hypothetical protein
VKEDYAIDTGIIKYSHLFGRHTHLLTVIYHPSFLSNRAAYEIGEALLAPPSGLPAALEPLAADWREPPATPAK